MQKLSDLLSPYFNDKPSSDILLENRLGLVNVIPHMPVKPCIFSWEVHKSPERFSKTYLFQNRNRLADFVREILTFEDEFNHHGTHKISNDEVTIEVYTHDVNKITNIDQEYVKIVDEIYKDVLDFAY